MMDSPPGVVVWRRPTTIGKESPAVTTLASHIRTGLNTYGGEADSALRSQLSSIADRLDGERSTGADVEPIDGDERLAKALVDVRAEIAKCEGRASPQRDELLKGAQALEVELLARSNPAGAQSWCALHGDPV